MQRTNPSLVLSSDDVLNTNFDCEPLGIHYHVSTDLGFLGPGKTTQVRRRDNQPGRFDVIAEWERHSFQPDIFKFTGAGSIVRKTVPVSTFLVEKNSPCMLESYFIGDDGRRYTWTVKGSELVAHVIENGRKDSLIANFHRRTFFVSQNGYLELFPGYEGTLDSLIGGHQRRRIPCSFHVLILDVSDLPVHRMEAQAVQ